MNVCILLENDLVSRAGGPSGYLYNLREGLKKINNTKHKIDFLYLDNKKNKEQINNNYKTRIKNIILSSDFLREKLVIREYKKKECMFDPILLNEYDIIYFHSTLHFYKYYNKISSKVIKVLMSHSPELTGIEVADIYKNKSMKKYNYNKLESFICNNIDRFAFKKADYIIFPSEESIEPYVQTMNDFSEVFNNKSLLYMMTGSNELSFTNNRVDIREKYNIPKDAFLISYIGRKNEIKGFDKFKEIIYRLLMENKNIYVITAGKGPIKVDNKLNWIDIEWTSKPGDLINASDLFILPNKRTYFDLVLLEVLSLAKPIVATNTGGNKTVAQLTNGGIYLYDYENTQNAVDFIKNLVNDEKKILSMSNLNRETFLKYFTLDKFAKRFIDILDQIESDKFTTEVENE